MIHTSAEGAVTYKAMLYIPSHTPYDFYTREYEKGLQLYSSGVLIMDKCADLQMCIRDSSNTGTVHGGQINSAFCHKFPVFRVLSTGVRCV